MKKYQIITLENKQYFNKAGTLVDVPPLTKTAVILKDSENTKIICYIPDFYQDTESIANGIARCLNKNITNIILPLKI